MSESTNRAPWWVWPLAFVACFGMAMVTAAGLGYLWLTQPVGPSPTPGGQRADLARLVTDQTHRAELSGYFLDLSDYLAISRKPLETTGDFDALLKQTSQDFIELAELPPAGTYGEASREIGRRIEAIVGDGDYPMSGDRDNRSLLIRELRSIGEDLAS